MNSGGFPCSASNPRSCSFRFDRRAADGRRPFRDRKSTRLNSSHVSISYAVFCLKKNAKLESKDALRHALRPPRTATKTEGIMVLVETAGLTKVFGDVRAVDDLTVKIPDGAVGLVGPNGAGKTTFLRLLLGLLQPTAGTAKVLGRDIVFGVPAPAQIYTLSLHDALPI